MSWHRVTIDETFAISKALCKTCKAKWDKLLSEDKEAEIGFCKSCNEKIKTILGGIESESHTN